MKAGFVPALGTPLDRDGILLKDSLARQVEMMLDAGAVGMLAMGSMGQQPYIRNDQCPEVAKTVVEVVAGRVPVFVGAMDNSIARVKQRLEAMEDLDVAGFVFTPPYYEAMTDELNLSFYRQVAKCTKHDIYIYDLPGTVKSKISVEMVLSLLKEVPNLGGIKSADLQLHRRLLNDPDVPESFVQLFSGIDVCDIAYKYGIHTTLDGMYSCTPVNTQKMCQALAAGQQEQAARYLMNILEIRNYMFEVDYDLWPAYSHAMNALGCPGIYYPDYCWDICDESKAKVVEFMKQRGEIF
jgi:4-hydroxy-tetrahydrodipicolinate synthase